MSFFHECLVFLLSLKFIEGSKFRCDYIYSTDANAWFKHNVMPEKWSDARLRCALEGAILASPITLEIETEMKEILKKYFTEESEIFTGIHATFSPGDYYSIEGIPLSEISLPWSENEPDNKGNNENCITFNGDGELSDHSCEEARPYICYRSGDAKTILNECGTIDDEYRLDTRTKSCYKFHTIPRNYSRAFFTCSAEGGHLAVINNDIEAKVLQELFKKYPAGNMEGKFWKDVAFIGGHDWGEPMEWRTIQGQTLWEAGYAKFKAGEPNNASPGENCVAIYRNGQLNDLWCDRPAAFICEKSPDFMSICNTAEVIDLEKLAKEAVRKELEEHEKARLKEIEEEEEAKEKEIKQKEEEKLRQNEEAMQTLIKEEEAKQKEKEIRQKEEARQKEEEKARQKEEEKTSQKEEKEQAKTAQDKIKTQVQEAVQAEIQKVTKAVEKAVLAEIEALALAEVMKGSPNDNEIDDLAKKAVQAEKDKRKKTTEEAKIDNLAKEALQSEIEKQAIAAVQAEIEKLVTPPEQATIDNLAKIAVKAEIEKISKATTPVEIESLAKAAVLVENEKLSKALTLDEINKFAIIAMHTELKKLAKAVDNEEKGV